MERYAIPQSYYILRSLAVFVEFVAVFIVCSLLLDYQDGFSGTLSEQIVSQSLIFSLMWVGLAAMLGQYAPVNFVRLRHLLGTFPVQVVLHLVGVFVYMLLIQRPEAIWDFTLPYLGVSIALAGYRMALKQIHRYRRILFRGHKVVIVGSGKTANMLDKFFTSSLADVHRFLAMDTTWAHESASHVQQEIDQVKEFCLREHVDEIYYALPLNAPQAPALIEDMSTFADNNYINFRIANEYSILNRKAADIQYFNRTPVFALHRNPLSTSLSNRLTKRMFDVVFSGLVLITIFPVIYLIVGTLIKLSSPGPVFYRQWRSGRRNEKFLCWKFRTMRVQKDDKFVQATKHDPRVTRIGAFLRKTSLDEFPQFINVFLGHMSVVGPRPHPLPLNDIFAPEIQEYFFRYYITPGITGYAQVNGFRGETKDAEAMRKRIEFDTWYIQNWSLKLDLKIIWLTVANVFKGEENAY
ncbi:MAG: undecaprenyl-phosphate glucose phosphotransferase [Bacteroidia bacterium]